jgi:4-hydroxybenzoyl-CoA thioesterase
VTFCHRETVRFSHVDAAGIVFYPRYFEMLNAAVEEYFRSLGTDFATMHRVRGLGVPTVRIQIDFTSPSQLGDELDFALTPEQVGRSSVHMAVEVNCAEERRLMGHVVLVCMDLASARAMPWPDDIKPSTPADMKVV